MIKNFVFGGNYFARGEFVLYINHSGKYIEINFNMKIPFSQIGSCPSSGRGGGGLSSGTLGGLGVVGCRSLGDSSPLLRVSGPFLLVAPSLTCSAPPSELQPLFHPGVGSCRCGGGSSGGGYRTCVSFPRLLQPFVRHTQGHRWVAPGDRPLAPQRLGGSLPFPHGDSPVGSPVSPSGGLDGVSGSPGRLPPGSGPSIFSSVPEVLRGGVCLPVSRPLLRPVDGSAGVYSCHVPGLFDHASS